MGDVPNHPPTLPAYDVAVIGAGPVGLTAANLLAARGHRVLVLEQHGTTSDEAKAISLDDESLRTLQAAGLADAVLDIVVPGLGTRYYDRNGRPLFLATTATPDRLGYPFKNPFSQPELERVLRTALTGRTTVDVLFGHTLTALAQDESGVDLTVATPDGQRAIRVPWVLGCDGGRSTVRRVLDISMAGRGFEDRWLVADTVGDPHDERYGMHHGDPRRPHVIVPGRGGRCRYEFRLRADEPHEPGTTAFEELVLRLVGGHRPIAWSEVERATSYTFHALIARRWRAGRCFLLGDAAHMMPPFAGQGLNSGIRDAGNLCWKLTEVIDGRLAPAILDSYETERRPHTEATVALSTRLGDIVMTGSHLRATVRDVLVRAARTVPPLRRYLDEMRYRPVVRHRDGLVVPGRRTGSVLAQPRVHELGRGRARLLDDVLGPGWSLLGVDLDTWTGLDACPELARLTEHRIDVSTDGRLRHDGTRRPLLIDVDGALHGQFAPYRGHVLLVRPDRVVAAVLAPSAPHLGPVPSWLAAAPVIPSTWDTATTGKGQ